METKHSPLAKFLDRFGATVVWVVWTNISVLTENIALLLRLGEERKWQLDVKCTEPVKFSLNPFLGILSISPHVSLVLLELLHRHLC